MSANNGASNAANVASRKRKGTTGVYNQVGSSSKRVALELFPTSLNQNELISHVSQSPGLNHDTNGGYSQISSPQNFQSFTSLLNNGHYTDQDDTYLLNNMRSPSEAPEDPFEKLLKSQYEKMRETCKQYFNNKYNYLLWQAEERASRICKEKDMEMANLRSMIFYLEEKVASDSARLEQQNDVIKNKNTELDTIRRKYIEQEEQVVHFKSQAEFWKERVERAEEMLWNATVSGRRQAPCCCEDEEDTALSSVGETREVVKGVIEP